MGYLLFRMLSGLVAILSAFLLIIDTLISVFDETKDTAFCFIFRCSEKGVDYIAIAVIYIIIIVFGAWTAFSKG